MDAQQTQEICRHLGRIATCMETFLKSQQTAADKPVSELITEAMDAFYEANPVVAMAMKRLEEQTKGGQRAVGSG